MQPSRIETLVIWCLMDGKPGHQNQSLGLAQAIGRQRTSQIIEIPLHSRTRGWHGLFSNVDSEFETLPKPDLILGAGHCTHLPMLRLRRQYGGRSIVLMRPSLPARCFDFCLSPDLHRLQKQSGRMIMTRGVLNRVMRSDKKNQQQGLILLGGPSKHFHWSNEDVIRQVSDVVSRSQEITWTVGTSRRTPASLVQLWQECGLPVDLVLAEEAPSGWLLDQYASAGTIWVTEDSVSMTYEAVTSGSRVGLIELTAKANNRVTRSINALVESADVVRHSSWNSAIPIPINPVPLAEADRCASIVVATLATQQESAIQAA